MPPKIKGGQKFKKNKPLNVIKASSQTPKKIFVYCATTLKIPR